MAKKFLTLNIGTTTVELAEYEQRGKSELTLLKYGVAHLDTALDFATADTILSPALLGLIRDTGIRPGPVALTVPGQSVFTKFAAVPMAGGAEKFEQMVLNEIEQTIPFPIDEMVCDRQVLGDTESGDKSVMIVAAKTDQVEAITSAVSAAGFVPELVDSAPGALTNAVRYVHPETSEACTVTLWLASKATSLVITEGDKVYTRLIQVGCSTLDKEIASACSCTLEEAARLRVEKGYVSMGGVTEDEEADRISKACRVVMTRLNAEISRSVNFYRSQQNGSAPIKLYLTGGMALLPQIDAFFAESLGIDVEFFNPFDRIAVGSGVDASALESDAAYLGATAGLAAGFVGGARFNVNLLPPSILKNRAEKAKIPVIVGGGGALVAALVLAMLGFNNETAVVEAQREGVEALANGLASFDKKVAAATKDLEASQAEANAIRELLAARAHGVLRLNAVRNALLPGMWIERWENGKVTVRYWADNAKAAGSAGKTAGELVAEKIQRSPAVDPQGVKIAEMSTVGKDAEVKQFTVEVKFK